MPQANRVTNVSGRGNRDGWDESKNIEITQNIL